MERNLTKEFPRHWFAAAFDPGKIHVETQFGGSERKSAGAIGIVVDRGRAENANRHPKGLSRGGDLGSRHSSGRG